MTCEHVWRRISSPSGDLAVMISTEASSVIGVDRSTGLPFTLTARAAFARPAPIFAAISAPDVTPSKDSVLLSGSTIETMENTLFIK